MGSHQLARKETNGRHLSKLMTSILFLFFWSLSSQTIFIYIYITPSHHTNKNYWLSALHAYQTVSILQKTHCKEEMSKQTTQPERKQNCILICTNIYYLLILIFSIALPHIFFVFFFSTGKTHLQGHRCSFCPTNMYNTYTLYIYIYICQLHKKGGQLAKLTEMEGTNILRRHSWQQTHPQRSVIIIKKTCNSISAAETVTLRRQERKEGWCKM